MQDAPTRYGHPFNAWRWAKQERILGKPLQCDWRCNLGCFVRAFPTSIYVYMRVHIYTSMYDNAQTCMFSAFVHARFVLHDASRLVIGTATTRYACIVFVDERNNTLCAGLCF